MTEIGNALMLTVEQAVDQFDGDIDGLIGQLTKPCLHNSVGNELVDIPAGEYVEVYSYHDGILWCLWDTKEEKQPYPAADDDFIREVGGTQKIQVCVMTDGIVLFDEDEE